MGLLELSRELEKTEMVKLQMSAKMGTELASALREAMIVCVSQWTTVELDFNGTKHEVNPLDLLCACKELKKEDDNAPGT